MRSLFSDSFVIHKEDVMVKGAKLLNALIDNSNKVRAYDFSHLNNLGDAAANASAPRKLSGVKMTKRAKKSDEARVSYTFAL